MSNTSTDIRHCYDDDKLKEAVLGRSFEINILGNFLRKKERGTGIEIASFGNIGTFVSKSNKKIT